MTTKSNDESRREFNAAWDKVRCEEGSWTESAWKLWLARDAEVAVLREALEIAECEMRYAGWATYDNENEGRFSAYEAVEKALANTTK